MIKVTGSRELIGRMRKDLAKMKGNLTRSHQRLVMMMFRDLVAHTPQWSGDLAMHWGIEFHSNKAPGPYSVKNPGWARQEQKIPQLQEPFQMGQDPAVSIALAREFAKIPEIRYNSIVKFVNRQPYAEEVQRGVGPNGKPIRDVNRVASFGGVAMIAYIEAKYDNQRELKKALVK